MNLLADWFAVEDWSANIQCQSVDKKANLLMSQILGAVNKYLPTKTIRVASDDEPWYSQALKKLDRRRRREYNKNRRSPKYQNLNKIYIEKLERAKIKYKRNIIDDIKEAKPGEWYSKLKRISRYDQGKSELLQVEEISHLSAQEQAERIADKQADISNSYQGVKLEDIQIPPFLEADIPQFGQNEVKEYIMWLKSKKSTPSGDIPVKILKEFAHQISIPLCDLINCSLKKGKWADCFKKEIITPIPKEYPVLNMDMLRPISALLSFNKVQEMIFVKMIVQDMSANLDQTQYGNRKHTSISHYLVRMLHRILSETDNNSRRKIKAVICTFVDWQQANSRQSHILGVKSFAKNGVRPSLLPLLTSYFQSREMRIKWHGVLSKPRKMPGSGAMGSTIGNWEFDSQTNHNADCVPVDDRFKFVDDLSLLEVVNLVNIGISSFNCKVQVPNDLPTHEQFVSPNSLKTQEYLNKINLWTEKQEMIISEKKTKSMIVNFTDKFQFHTRLQLKGQSVQIVEKTKILGTILTNNLSWNENCSNLIKKVNAQMQLLRKVWSFGSSCQEMVHLWKVFCRSVLEQSCVSWDSGLTQENRNNLERTQKTFLKLVLQENYQNYNNALKISQLETLDKRRKELTLRFAQTSLADGLLHDLFPIRKKQHNIKIRNKERYKVFHANTERFKNSPILTMQRMLNKVEKQT